MRRFFRHFRAAVESAEVVNAKRADLGRLSAATLYWKTRDKRAQLLQGDSLEILEEMPAESVDTIFADPPYFLSNGGTTCKNGRRTSVDKGKWDRSRGAEENHEFNRRWLAACKRVLKPNGTIWVSGTSHVIYSVGYAMQQLDFKQLNEIVWEKPNPPPNLSCRYFTHATESVLWAARDRKSKHFFNYARMRELNEGKQMKTVWRMTAPSKSEKTHGKHPTQKPLSLLDRIIEASCDADSVVLDPFNGSGTTGVAALTRGHRYIGIEREPKYLELSKARLQAAAGPEARAGKGARPSLRVV
ncbi:MAG: site-specific DNA-methyltransferase [Myxococcales bacterium]|nr:site-specific DNA-methyltransferase [Myxococcales bacterium]MCB9749868.1 site-specific DNA-methyltransferase [Myxococcales bacterium]